MKFYEFETAKKAVEQETKTLRKAAARYKQEQKMKTLKDHTISGLGEVHTIEHDGFTGEIIGEYTTREGKEGVVMQQIGTRVVHVYGRKWLKEVE